MKKNRRDFLKLLGLGAIAPIVPKINPEPTTTAPTLIAGKIKTGGLIANIEAPERMRISSNGDIGIGTYMYADDYKFMQRFNEAYEKQLWAGNAITEDKVNSKK